MYCVQLVRLRSRYVSKATHSFTTNSLTMPVAIVTGSNKGIGFATVRALCGKFPGDVYLTSRSEERGQAAVKTLREEGLDPKFHVLDIGNEQTIVKLREFIEEKYGGIDVLVNNAGIAFNVDATEAFAVQAKVTLETNYWANKRACEILFPLLNPGARVVNVSSSCGFLGQLVKRVSMRSEKRLGNCVVLRLLLRTRPRLRSSPTSSPRRT